MKNYEKYKAHARKITDIQFSCRCFTLGSGSKHASKGADFRAQQLATLSEISHNLSVDNDYGKLLENLDGCSNLSKMKKKYKAFFEIFS